MRIWQLVDARTIGGIERHVATLVTALLARGHAAEAEGPYQLEVLERHAGQTQIAGADLHVIVIGYGDVPAGPPKGPWQPLMVVIVGFAGVSDEQEQMRHWW